MKAEIRFRPQREESLSIWRVLKVPKGCGRMASRYRNLCRKGMRLTYNGVEKARIPSTRIYLISMVNEQGTSVSHQYTGTYGPIQEEILHFAGFGV